MGRDGEGFREGGEFEADIVRYRDDCMRGYDNLVGEPAGGVLDAVEGDAGAEVAAAGPAEVAVGGAVVAVVEGGVDGDFLAEGEAR